MDDRIEIEGSGIKGDITRCKIESKLLKIEQSSVLSLQKRETYITYDVCNKEILETYSVPSITFPGLIVFMIFAPLAVMLIPASLLALLEKISNKI